MRTVRWIVVYWLISFGFGGIGTVWSQTIISLSPIRGDDHSWSPDLRVRVLGDFAEEVVFRGRKVEPVPPDFTVVVIPDTQRYVIGLDEGDPSFFKDQIDWVVANRAASNIVSVSHVGDIVQDYDNDAGEWAHAACAMHKLEDPVATGLAEGIPYGLVVGNHDLSGDQTTFYNQYFGPDHFADKSYYGGNFGDNNYVLFEVGTLKFVNLNIIWQANLDFVGPWAEAVVQAFPDRLVFVTTHHASSAGFPSSFSGTGQGIYDRLKVYPNVFMITGGHAFGDGRREDVFEGRMIHTFLSNYQGLPNGGNGWLRMYRFSPANGTIRAITYSPVLDGFMDGDTSDFTIPFDFDPWMGGEWLEIGRVTNVVAGEDASVPWTGLAPLTDYEWFAEAGGNQGPVAQFETGLNAVMSITRDVPVSGATAEVSWTSYPGVEYIVEASNGIPGSPWVEVGNVLATGDRSVWLAGDEDHRVFRVGVVRE